MFINDYFIENLSNCDGVKYLFDFTANNFELFLTTGDQDILLSDKIYKNGVVAQNIKIDNLSQVDDIFIKIMSFYDKKLIYIEKLLHSKVTIKIAIKKTDKNQEFISYDVFNGFVSKIIEDNGILLVTISSLMSCFNQSIGELFSPICRECLGSQKCGVDLNSYKTNGVILDIIADDCFLGNHQNGKQMPIGYYDYGLIKFLSGFLKGICLQVKSENNGKIYLLRSTKLLNKDDKYEIYAGCDKSTAMCKEKFNNIINFRGEPFIENNNKN